MYTTFEKVEELERDVVELAAEKRNAEELLMNMKWQTSMLVLQAFGIFVWSKISNNDREELVKYGVANFRDMVTVYIKWGPRSAAGMAARRIYKKIDVDLKNIAEQIILSKEDINERRNLLARPTVSDAQVKKFLEALGDGGPGLPPMEIALFEYLKATTNTEANILEARRG